MWQCASQLISEWEPAWPSQPCRPTLCAIFLSRTWSDRPSLFESQCLKAETIASFELSRWWVMVYQCCLLRSEMTLVPSHTLFWPKLEVDRCDLDSGPNVNKRSVAADIETFILFPAVIVLCSKGDSTSQHLRQRVNFLQETQFWARVVLYGVLSVRSSSFHDFCSDTLTVMTRTRRALLNVVPPKN